MLPILPFALNNSSDLDKTTLDEILKIINIKVDPRDETSTLIKPSKYLPSKFLDGVLHRTLAYRTHDGVTLILDPTTAMSPTNPEISFFVVEGEIYNQEGVIVQRSNELITIDLDSGKITREQLNQNSVVIKTITASVSLSNTVSNNVGLTNVLELDNQNKISVNVSEDDSSSENSFKSIDLNSNDDSQNDSYSDDSDFVHVPADEEENSENSFINIDLNSSKKRQDDSSSDDSDIFVHVSNEVESDFEFLEYLNEVNDDVNSEKSLNNYSDDSEESEESNEQPPVCDILREYLCRKIIGNHEGDKNVFLAITELNDNRKTVDVTTQLIMPYLAGQTLETYLLERDDKKPIQLDVILYMLAIIRDLVKLHKIGIVAGDLRPSNIMLNEKDNKKIATIFDFDGSAIFDNSIFENIPNVFEEIVADTPHFMPPEACVTNLIKGAKSYDIFSVGVIFALLLGWGYDSKGLQASEVNSGRIYSPLRTPEHLNSSEDNRLSPYRHNINFSENTYYIDINSFPKLDEKFKSIIVEYDNEAKLVSVRESLLSLIRKMIGLDPTKRPEAETIETILVNLQEKIISADNITSAETKYSSQGPFFKSKSLPSVPCQSPSQHPARPASP